MPFLNLEQSSYPAPLPVVALSHLFLWSQLLQAQQRMAQLPAERHIGGLVVAPYLRDERISWGTHFFHIFS